MASKHCREEFRRKNRNQSILSNLRHGIGRKGEKKEDRIGGKDIGENNDESINENDGPGNREGFTSKKCNVGVGLRLMCLRTRDIFVFKSL